MIVFFSVLAIFVYFWTLKLTHMSLSSFNLSGNVFLCIISIYKKVYQKVYSTYKTNLVLIYILILIPDFILKK